MKKVLLSLMIMIFFWACEDSAPLSDVGNKRLIDYGTIYRDTLYAAADTSIVMGKIDNGYSPKLLLGSYAGFEARPLMKFFRFPADTFVIDSVKLLLRSNSNFGEANSDVSGKIYMITASWAKDVNKDESWDYQANIETSTLTTASFSLQPADTGTYQIVLPDTLIKIWQDTTGGDKNNGILIDFESADHIIELLSAEVLYGPRMVTMYHAPGQDSVYSDTVYAGSDAYLVNYTGSFNPQQRLVVSGYPVHSFFKFNLNLIPQTAQISNVDFHFNIDTVNSILNISKAKTLFIRTVTTDFNLLKQGQFEVDSSFTISSKYSVALSEESENIMSLDPTVQADAGQYFIQSLINKNINYGSFYLQYVSEYYDISVMALEGVNSSNPPYLIVEYYDTPKPRL